jgi:hypothetical protein
MWETLASIAFSVLLVLWIVGFWIWADRALSWLVLYMIKQLYFVIKYLYYTIYDSMLIITNNFVIEIT